MAFNGLVVGYQEVVGCLTEIFASEVIDDHIEPTVSQAGQYIYKQEDGRPMTLGWNGCL